VRVSVVVPVFESLVLEELVERIGQALSGADVSDYEVILVDDGSTDPRVWLTMERLAAARNEVGAIQLCRNFGQQAATLCGMARARGDVVVTLDDDLQHDPAEIPNLLAQAHHDVVIGQLGRARQGWIRRLVSRAKGFCDRVLIGKPPGMQLSSFRLLGRTVVDAVVAIRTPHPFLPALIFQVTRDVVGAPVTHHPRRQGRSGYGPRKLWRLFSNLLISNSSLLLRVIGALGVTIAAVSSVAAGVVLYRKLEYGVAVRGWSSLMCAVLLLGGLILFALGVIGEYLIRIIESGERRPTFVVRRTTGAVIAGGRAGSGTPASGPSAHRREPGAADRR
jgi:dolichol-phosphate mannosyltransferase/undecaprenyl-phosphate 4-deoxy-4-formamido-L-arabinose transferase